MKKIKEIKLTPEILSTPLSINGSEEIYQIAQGSMIVYEDDSVSKGDRTSTKYYRAVDESRSNEEGIIKFTFLDHNTFEFGVKYLEPIKIVDPIDQTFNVKNIQNMRKQ